MLCASDVDRFCGLPYCARTMDCADLVVLVQRELFGRTVLLPGMKRPRPLRLDQQAAELELHAASLAHRVEVPTTGDLVLMLDTGQTRPGHAGTYFFLAHEQWVLHTTHHIGASRLHRVRELPSLGLRIEGFYQWK